MKISNTNLYLEVESIYKRLNEILEEDEKTWEPDQQLNGLHDDIEEFIYQCDKYFNDDEDLTPTPITADERWQESWEQKRLLQERG